MQTTIWPIKILPIKILPIKIYFFNSKDVSSITWSGWWRMESGLWLRSCCMRTQLLRTWGRPADSLGRSTFPAWLYQARRHGQCTYNLSDSEKERRGSRSECIFHDGSWALLWGFPGDHQEKKTTWDLRQGTMEVRFHHWIKKRKNGNCDFLSCNSDFFHRIVL